MALGNVNEAPLQLNTLGIKDARMGTAIIADRIFSIIARRFFGSCIAYWVLSTSLGTL